MKESPQGTVFTGTLSIAHTILGSGMLAMPYAIASVGLIPGLLLVLGSGSASAFALWLLTHCGNHLKLESESSESPFNQELETGGSIARPLPVSFFALASITYPKAAILFDSAIAIKCFGVATSYLVVIGDLMPQVILGFNPLLSGTVWVSRSLWISLAMIIIIPLSSVSRLDSLRHTSLIALCSVAYLVGLVITFFLSPEFPFVPEEVDLFRFSPDIMKTLPIFVFAFTCHQNIFSVQNELKNNSQTQLNLVIVNSITLALGVYYIIGVLGYLMYGQDISGNLINMCMCLVPLHSMFFFLTVWFWYSVIMRIILLTNQLIHYRPPCSS
jgi:amino acid permease